MAYIDEHVGVRHVDADGPGLRWGVESICAQLTELGAKMSNDQNLWMSLGEAA